MYGSMGSYGGYGGSGYSGMSSMGSYGSGYGSLRPGGQSQTGDQPQEQNLRTEYYGMVGGLNSILQLGFAGLSLTVFVQNLAKILQTAFGWIKSVITRLGKFVANLPLVRMLPLLLAKLHLEAAYKVNNTTTSNKLVYLLRLLALVGIVIMVYAKSQMKNQIDKEYQDMVEQAAKQRNESESLELFEGPYYQKQGFF